jgi:tetratricopeptide (TPR) repeat protein
VQPADRRAMKTGPNSPSLRKARFLPASLCLLAVLCAGLHWRGFWGLSVAAEAVPKPALPAFPSDGIEDSPEPLRPVYDRSPAERDRLEALAMFAAGRTHERRGEYARALQLYQRAWRNDPYAVEALAAIVPLAYRLGREDVAIRYALCLPDGALEPLLLRRLAIRLTEREDWRGAVTLYQKALGERIGKPQSATDVLLDMEMGRLYHLDGDYAKAAECFAAVLAALKEPEKYQLDQKVQKILVGEGAQTYILFGECFAYAGRLEEATAALETARQLKAHEATWNYCMARVRFLAGDCRQALEMLEKALAGQLPDEGTAPYELLAQVLEKLGKQAELIGRLEKLHAAQADNVALGLFLADQYRKNQMHQKAISQYRAVLGAAPLRSACRDLLELLASQRNIELLLDVLGELFDKTGVLETLGAEGQAIANDPALVAELAQAARKRLQQKPESLSYGARTAIALLALESEQFPLAAEFFQHALEARPDRAGHLLLLWGLGLLVGQRTAEAAKVFQRGLEDQSLSDRHALFHFYLAGALAAQEDHQQALPHIQAAVKLRPEMPRFQSRLGLVLMQLRRYDEAAAVYRKLLDRFGDDYSSSETREAVREARMALSHLAVLGNRLAEAEEYLEQILDEFPEDPGAYNDLGYLWADQGKHLHRAKRMIELAVEAEPDNSAYRDSLGWVLFRLGQYRQAIVELEKAAAGRPDGVILDHLGDAYLKVGDRHRAKEAFGRAAEAFRKQHEEEKARLVEDKLKLL